MIFGSPRDSSRSAIRILTKAARNPEPVLNLSSVSLRHILWTGSRPDANFGAMMMTSDAPLSGRCVLITDGDHRAALAVTRSLGAAGARVVVSSTTGASITGASRFASLEIQLPDPLEHPTRYVTLLGEIVERNAVDLLLPITEASLRPVLAARNLFVSAKLPFPAADTFAHASDKRRLWNLAARHQVPVPRQIVVDAPEACDEATMNLPPYPLVLKPAVSVAETHGKQVKLAVRHIANRKALLAALAALPLEAYPVLLQERIVGPGIGLFFLRWDGRTIARFAHRRIREKPPSGGVSVYRESMDPPVQMVQYGETLLAALDWHGVAMVEFKLDRETGIPHLMEINGRFWGSLQLAVDAGVDFPRLLAEAAFGILPTGIVDAKRHMRLRWLLGDLDHVLLRLSRSRQALSLEPGAPSRLAALGSFLVPWRPGDHFEVCRLSDLRPFHRELRRWVADVLR